MMYEMEGKQTKIGFRMSKELYQFLSSLAKNFYCFRFGENFHVLLGDGKFTAALEALKRILLSLILLPAALQVEPY